MTPAQLDEYREPEPKTIKEGWPYLLIGSRASWAWVWVDEALAKARVQYTLDKRHDGWKVTNAIMYRTDLQGEAKDYYGAHEADAGRRLRVQKDLTDTLERKEITPAKLDKDREGAEKLIGCYPYYSETGYLQERSYVWIDDEDTRTPIRIRYTIEDQVITAAWLYRKDLKGDAMGILDMDTEDERVMREEILTELFEALDKLDRLRYRNIHG